MAWTAGKIAAFRVLASGGLLMLGACGGGDAEPSGQVVATVAGEEITLSQLEAEMRFMSSAAQTQDLRKAALESLVNREILAAAAEEEGLASLPETSIRLERLRKIGLVESLSDKIVKSAAAPSQDEIAIELADNPALYGQRRLLLVDQAVTGPVTQDVLKAMEPLETLPEIRRLLQSRKIDFAETVAMIDPLALSAEQARLLDGMTSGQVFVIPTGGGVRINRIREIIPAPLAGEGAKLMAKSRIEEARKGQMVANRLQQIVEAGRQTVRYNSQIAAR